MQAFRYLLKDEYYQEIPAMPSLIAQILIAQILAKNFPAYSTNIPAERRRSRGWASNGRAGAADMRASFTGKPDFTPYNAEQPKHDLFEVNLPLKALRGAVT